MSAPQSRQRSSRQTPPARAAATNGKPPERLAEARVYEDAIAAEAADIRGRAQRLTGKSELTAELYLELWPLLRRPIPPGFIVTTPAVKGKPYESTGIKSLQVQIDRMDNVLTPLWWEWETLYGDEGRLAHVLVFVGPKARPLVRREAHGGVNQASTGGNLYKGSETNAAKLALARVGPGHEIYVGATDLDPDVSPEAAEQQQHAVGEYRQVQPARLTREQVVRVERGIEAAGLAEQLPVKLRALGLDTLAEATTEHAAALWEWMHAETSAGTDGESNG